MMRQVSFRTEMNLPLTLFLVMLFLIGGGPGMAAEEHAPGNKELRAVETAPVELRDFQSRIQATGTLVPQRHSGIYALAAGQVEKLSVDIGDPVSKGDLLFRIRTVDYRLALQQAEANLERAGVMVRDRKREKERIENLFAAGSATQQMYDRSQTAHEEAAAALAQARAARDIARQSLADCTITAPYNGVITARYLEEGEFIGKGKKVLEIIDLSVLNAEMELPERYAGKITTGLPVRLSFSYRSDTVEGTTVAVNPKLNPLNRTFLVKVAVDNREGALQAGLFSAGTFMLPVQNRQTAIPSDALIRDEGRSYIWVVNQDDRVSRRIVKEGDTFNGNVWILEGLAAGERIVVKGQGGLIEGDRVAAE